MTSQMTGSIAALRRLTLLVAALLALHLAAPSPAFADSAQKAAPEEAQGLAASLNSALESFNGVIVDSLFFSITGDLFTAREFDKQGSPVLDAAGNQKEKPIGFPFIVFVLVSGGIFFTLFFRFVNLRGAGHAVAVLQGKFDDPKDEGEVSHFQAFTSALSATVGLGNIAGVAIAIQVGGPGATLWMVVAAFFGMSMKFNSCTLAQMYRKKNPDGSFSGGPMYYLEYGLKKLSPNGPIGHIGKVLAVVYSLMIIGGSFGGGNMFQANQSFGALQTLGVQDSSAHAVGITLAVMVGLVILGGIRRIGAATSKIVPLMVAIYTLAALYIIAVNISEVPATFSLVVGMAFSKNALFGGTVGVIVQGFKRASFSNEAGVGSAAIAHAAAKTDEPVREGLVAMLGPLVDTVLVCTMTALVVVISGVWNDPALTSLGGVQLTSAAFAQTLPWFPTVLTVCVLLFAYSTMISWAYYGERGWIYLMDQFKSGFGLKSLTVYRGFFVAFVYIGTVTNAEQVLTFSDLMILCMALPNILGSVLLAPAVKRLADDYLRRLRSGAFSQQPTAAADDPGA